EGFVQRPPYIALSLSLHLWALPCPLEYIDVSQTLFDLVLDTGFHSDGYAGFFAKIQETYFSGGATKMLPIFCLHHLFKVLSYLP
ncbi:hypothetical protein, partial [Tolypothrix sp. PCC 7601]|uniref:hypothetical protein n=1 Tax=Tolypothrix sp. PCC 7601 TaxID=1188 RepID=UPI0005EAC50A